jgi:hypothetical protein
MGLNILFRHPVKTHGNGFNRLKSLEYGLLYVLTHSYQHDTRLSNPDFFNRFGLCVNGAEGLVAE